MRVIGVALIALTVTTVAAAGDSRTAKQDMRKEFATAVYDAVALRGRVQNCVIRAMDSGDRDAIQASYARAAVAVNRYYSILTNIAKSEDAEARTATDWTAAASNAAADAADTTSDLMRLLAPVGRTRSGEAADRSVLLAAAPPLIRLLMALVSLPSKDRATQTTTLEQARWPLDGSTLNRRSSR